MNIYDKIRKKLQEASERRQQAFSNFKWLTDEKTVVRVLPKNKNQNNIFFEGARHFGLGETGKQNRLCPKAVYACLDEEAECPICEESERLLASSNTDDKAIGKELKASRRYFFNVIVRGEEEKGVQILEVAETVWEQIVGYFFIMDDSTAENDEAAQEIDLTSGPYKQLDDGTIVFNFVDPIQGRDFIIERKSQGKRTTYDVKMKPQARKLGTTEQMKEWMTQVVNLDEYVPNACDSADSLKTLLYGEEEPEEVTTNESEETESGWEWESSVPWDEDDEKVVSEEESEDTLDEENLELDDNGEVVVKPALKAQKKVASKLKKSAPSDLKEKVAARMATRGKRS